VILLTIVRSNKSPLLTKQQTHSKMAIISSYPTIAPQLADKLLGSNNVDSLGDPVIGVPTVQYTMTSIKTLVDQGFVQQLSSSNIGNQPYPLTGNKIVFGAADSTSLNVTINAAGLITFKTAGTYYVQQKYLYGVTTQATRFFLFRTLSSLSGGISQYGSTSIDVTGVNMTNPERKPMYIDYMIKVIAGNTIEFESMLDANGNTEFASLYARTINQWDSVVPSAQVIISKLI
jgi:hypothetical protein